MQLLPWAIIFFLVYSVGFPVVVARILFGNSVAIKADQHLRAQNSGNTRATNPSYFDLRKRYHRLYYQFKPQYYYWVLVILGRKFLIAGGSLMFRRTPVFLLSFVLMVLFISYALQVRFSCHFPL